MQREEFLINPCGPVSFPEWAELRAALWPDTTVEEHRQDLTRLMEQPERYAQFIAHDLSGNPAGFVELCLRHDHVNGTVSSPVAFVEGLYTTPGMRRKGVAALLMKRAEAWAREKGCVELASDALVENTISHETHRALGFQETERVVYFRKVLQQD
ncbi:MAG: GNAT family N-acetyltransferase [Verrucomicrobiaceae bacterium]|nr:MAG: GNAT family N-acetyltransferase [Verrucomicrobiaceae bacterium]